MSDQITSTASTSIFYKHSGRIPFASKISLRARRAIYQRFEEVLSPCATDLVLDVGVTNDNMFQESNFFEKYYPYKECLTCVGTEDGSGLELQYPGVHFVPVAGGQLLPFPDKHFDIAFSNAVIEHVGNRESQSFFVREILRVCRRFFITTPNRWFPVEVHTGLPLLHYLAPATFRSLISRTRYRFWSLENNLNLLTRSEFTQLFPRQADVTVEFQGIGLGNLTSNLVAYGNGE